MISQDINDLIYIAERQSDERLAQELNPETETGMLGPPWLSASELSYRQKIRSEAQAEPSNAPSVVQQLAQTAMPQPLQNNMASVPPASTGMPQQPMPQQPMPQQPMPTQMMNEGGLLDSLSPMSGLGLMADAFEGGNMMGLLPMLYKQTRSEDEEENPTAMSAGGLLNYANGGMIDDPYALNLESPLTSPFPSASNPLIPSIPTIGLEQPTTMDDFIPLQDDDYMQSYIEGIDDPYTNKLGPYGLSGPLEERQIRERGIETTQELSPLNYKIREGARALFGFGDEEESEKEITSRKINTDLRDALHEIQIADNPLRGTQKGVQRYTQAEKFFEDLIDTPDATPTGRSWLQNLTEEDSLSMSRYFANNPDEFAALNYYRRKHGDIEGLLKFSEEYQLNEKGKLDRLIDKVDVTEEAVTTDGTPPPPSDGTPPPPSDGGKSATDLKNQGVQQSTASGLGQGVESDIGTGLIDTSIENIVKDMTDPKGKMQDKWLAIAAGAFNAAQKGSPTLMQGLADLGSGVVGQLQNLKKEDQVKAQQLFDLYKTKATIQSTLRGQNLDYLKDIADVTDQDIDRVIKATGDYHTQLNKLRETGKLDDVARMELAVSYAGLGSTDAQLAYQRGITTLAEQENIVEAEIRKDLELGLKDELTDEAELQIKNKMQEFLEDNPHLRILNEDYWSNAVDKDGKPAYKWNAANQLRFSP